VVVANTILPVPPPQNELVCRHRAGRSHSRDDRGDPAEDVLSIRLIAALENWRCDCRE
jgi:hypothetical protein